LSIGPSKLTLSDPDFICNSHLNEATFTIEKGLGDPFINIAQVKAVARES
jgi:hypothetical protein